MSKRAQALREALKLYRGSIRTLAREAGVSDRLIGLVRDGERSATRRTVEALAEALERLAERNANAARILRNSLDEEGP